MKRRIVLILFTLALLAALTISVSAEPSTDPAVLNKVYEEANKIDFSAGTENVTCPYCQEPVTWKVLPAATGIKEISGHYYVASDLTANTSYYYAKGTVCVHLNGHSITSTNAGAAFSAPSGTQLNIMGTGNVTGKGSKSQGAIFVYGGTARLFGGTYSRTAADAYTVSTSAANSTFEMYTGTTVNGAASTYAAIVNSFSTATLKMHGGTVDAKLGTAVSLLGGQFHQYGGTIKNSKRTNVIVNGGDYTLHDGSITGGLATISGQTTGGNVRLLKGSFTMNGGTISGGLAYTDGGNVHITAGTFTMNAGQITGGSLSGGTSAVGGGSTYMAGGTFEMKGGTVSGGSASGGNFYIAGGELKLNTGAPVIKNGKSTGYGGNIYIAGGAVTVDKGSVTQDPSVVTDGGNIFMLSGTLTVTGGTVSGGTIAGGGNLRIDSGTVNMSGGTISGGNGTTLGGNIYAEDCTFTMSGGTITTGTTAGNGGNVYMSANCDFIMTGGEISAGSAEQGGNVYLAASTATCTLLSGTPLVTGGTANDNGGNFHIYAGKLDVQSGTVTKGTANTTGSYHQYYYYGGGNIYVGSSSSAKATVSGGTVSDGVSTYRSGGNILCRGSGTLTVTGGTVSGGQSSYPGGNIMNGASTKVTISGGRITGGMGDVDSRKILNGDNIVSFGGTVTISGGIIESDGTTLGDGVLAYYTAKIILDGDAQITNAGKYGNIYIAQESGDATLQVCSTFTGTAGVAFQASHGAAPGQELTMDSSTGVYTGTVYAEELNGAGIFGTEDNKLMVAGVRVDDTWYRNNEEAVENYSGGTIVLYTEEPLALEGGSYTLDLAGQNVTATGNGTVVCFDSGNDTYETFGSLTLNGPTLENEFAEEFAGKIYFKLEEGGSYTFHRVNYQLTSVSMRPANGGIYYTGKWEADDTVKLHIDAFGVAVNLTKVPDGNFSAADGSMWTRFEKTEFVSGQTRNGVLITNIVRDDADPERIANNAAYGKMKIHATAYITVDGTNYAGNSMSYSLYDVLSYISSNINDYSSYSDTMVAFMDKWDDFGLTAEAGYDFAFSVKDSIKNLNALYADLSPYYGELHDHAATGGTSDGKYTLAQWKEYLPGLEMDFATILDHKQTSHMYLEDWDDTMLLGASEGHIRFEGEGITDVKVDFNMIFADPQALEEVLAAFPEFKWQYYPEDYTGTNAEKLAGGWHYSYPTNSTQKRFREIVKALQDAGGFVVIPHPKSSGYIETDDPMDAWYGDFTGIEVFYTYQQSQGDAKSSKKTAANYKLWTDMLAAGYKVYATAGNDDHNEPSNKAVSVVYGAQKNAQGHLDALRAGHFVAGGVGIRMAIGDTMMGGVCDFAGKEIAYSIGDWHSTHLIDGHEYEILLIDDRGVVQTNTVTAQQAASTQYFTYTAEETAAFYRVEIFDKTTGVRIVIGNPIWNEG